MDKNNEASEKDIEQDSLIARNAERITRNEEAIKRQTEALEKICDHYYPPPEKWWKRVAGFGIKALCVVLAYAGGVQALDWYFNLRKSNAMAAQCAEVARKIFFEEGNADGALQFYDKAVELDAGTVRYRIARAFVKNMASISRLFNLQRPFTAEERAMVDAALAEATFLCSAEPEDPLPFILSAQAQALRGERELAFKSVDRALALASEQSPVRVSACAMHFMCGDLAGARALLADAERRGINVPIVPFWKGMLALTMDRDAVAAQGYFETVTNRLPRHAMGYAMLGRVHLTGENPDFERAHAAFDQAVAADPSLGVALIGKAETFERENRLVLARLWLDRAVVADAKSMPALIARSRINERLNDAAAAIADLSAAIELAPMRADLYLERAKVYGKTGNDAGAKSDRAMSLELSN